MSARCEGRWDTPVVEMDSLAQAATLLRQRNAIDVELARLIHRPMTSGYLGEWIAAQIFDIELEASAVAAGIDGRFRSGPLQGRTVNIKWAAEIYAIYLAPAARDEGIGRQLMAAAAIWAKRDLTR